MVRYIMVTITLYTTCLFFLISQDHIPHSTLYFLLVCVTFKCFLKIPQQRAGHHLVLLMVENQLAWFSVAGICTAVLFSLLL